MKHDNLVKSNQLSRQLVADLPKLLLESVKLLKTEPVAPGRGPSDLRVEIATLSGRRRKLRIVLRALAIPSRVRELVRGMGNAGSEYPVLASGFLSPRVREICREEGVGYLDLAGNCFIRFDGVHLERIVDKNPFPKRGRPASVFSRVSSRVVRAVLEEPDRTWRVAELAASCAVSLGQASNVCRKLIDDAYLERSERGLRLAQPGQLLDAWTADTPLPHNATHAYYSFERDPQRLMRRIAAAARSHAWEYAVTSFAAASLVAPFVHGIAGVAMYVSEPTRIDEWVAALDLRPVEAGANCTLLSPYDAGVLYRAHAIDGIRVVGNVQLYLDLIKDPARGREQAEFLRSERLRY